MIFPLRAIHLSFWLFVAWLVLRVWAMNFEVSPLPTWTLQAFIFLMLFSVAFLLGKRAQAPHPLDAIHRAWALGLLVGSALLWEFGLTIYMNGWSAVSTLFTQQLMIGTFVELLAIFLAGTWLRLHPPEHHIAQEELPHTSADIDDVLQEKSDRERADASGNGRNPL